MANEHNATQPLWSATTDSGNYPLLSGNLEVDVAIVGAGITGLTTAYLLAKAGKRVAVLEAMRVGGGTTGSSTGNLYATVDERLYKVASKHDEATLKTVVNARTEAVNFIGQRVEELAIDCEFRRVSWYLFTSKTEQASEIRKEFEAAYNAGLRATDEAPDGLPYKTEASLRVADQAQFNPLKYVQGLAAAIAGANCQIFEDTKVLKVDDGEPCVVHTNRGTVRAAQVVMATHTPKGVYGVHTAMTAYREYALAVRLNGALPPAGTYWHLEGNHHYSVRPYSVNGQDYLLVLGEPHMVGHKEHNEEKLQQVEAYAREHFPVASIEYKWAAQNYKPADLLPYIGNSPLEKNIYIATGFSADGLAWGTAAGQIISDTILGRENPFADVFSPKRFTPVASAPRFLEENVQVVTNLVKDYLFTGNETELQDIPANEGKVVSLHGKKVAAYRDGQSTLHLVSAVCTHIGCIVHWNNAEKSWDCPCHGSRFSVDGEVLEGPAYNNLEKQEMNRGEVKNE